MAEKRSTSTSGSGGSIDGLAAKRPRLADTVTASSAGSGEWAEVIVSLQPAIVALRVSQVRHFEEDPAATALGTGFVVDRERGIILTNRHIVGCGPVRATALFDRHEELEVEVLYRDPVHDFGFFRYDPSKLRLTRQAEVPLRPEGLTVGTEIRVVGNDAGEKLQILSGTIARVDRNVPEFATVYNDENTFYAGAGAGTSGGSSGSPVLNKQGCAIALNAAGQEGAASAFFLPLDRVQVALVNLQAGQPVPRGTCLASFLFKPFDEMVRVGLQRKHEADVLKVFPDGSGMLLVDSVLCEQKSLSVGDILLRVNGEVCVGFVQLETALDAAVGGSVKMAVCRAGEDCELDVSVSDLHALIPRSFVELGLDVVHGLGYHAARRVHMPLNSGVYLARAGYVFDSLGCGRAALVTNVGKKPTPSLTAFVEEFSKIPDRQYFPVSWFELVDFRRDRCLKTGFAKMARAWSPMRLWHCESANGSPERWVATELPMPPAAALPAQPAAVGALVGAPDPIVRQLQPSLATVRFRTDRRFNMEGAFTGCSEGVGLLVDAEHGLVLTDRHSVPQSLGDVEVTLAGTTTVDAEVVFIHPLHNIAVVRCDMAPLGKAKLPLRAATLATGAKATLRPGESVYFVGFDGQMNTFGTRVTVAAVYLPSGRDEFPMWDVPRFRERSLEIVVLADTPEDARGGVLCDDKGVIRAVFAAFDWQGGQREETTESFGVAVGVFAPIVEALRQRPREVPSVRSLDLEVSAVDVATLARGAAGLPRDWLQAVGQRCGSQGQVPRALRVSRILPTGVSKGLLKPGDVLLAVDGHVIVGALDIETALRRGKAPAALKKRPAAAALKRPAGAGKDAVGVNGSAAAAAVSSDAVAVKVFRDGAEVLVSVSTALLHSGEDRQLLVWAGIVLRATPRCILERCGDSIAERASGVFAQAIMGGSPADARDFLSFWFLTDIEGVPIQRLDDVLAALQSTMDPQSSASERRWVRVRFLDLNGQEHVKALQCDPLFFPTLVLQRSSGSGLWTCAQH